jgi:predicted metalloprotease with PDZ domain
MKAIEKLAKIADFSYSLGFVTTKDDKFEDVIVNSPAYQAGLGPGMKLIAVNGRKYTPEVLHAAIKAAQGSTEPLDLLVENGQFFKTYSVPYHEGDKNPHLERISNQPDLLQVTLTPLTK